MNETKKIKYEKPEVVDFKWMEAMGNCSHGSAAAMSCTIGNAAAVTCGNGAIATLTCAFGGGD